MKEKFFDPYLGPVRKCYVGYATNEEIRLKASSGGVLTALLVGLLEEEQINGAFVVGMKEAEPWLAEPILATTKEAILLSTQSKYQPINFRRLLRNIPEHNRYVMVDRPCGIKYLNSFETRLGKNLKDRIAYRFGLFCGFEMQLAGTEFLLRKLKVKTEDIVSLEYRGGRWPGGFRVITKDGTEKFVSKDMYSLLAYIYASKKCLFCQDQTGELADISFGDAWFMGEKSKGYTAIIARNPRGESLIKTAREKGWVDIKEIDYQEIKYSHRFLCKYKKVGGRVRMNLRKKTRITENINPSLGPITEKDIIIQTLYYHIYKYRHFFMFCFNILPFNFFTFISKTLRRDIYKHVRESTL